MLHTLFQESCNCYKHYSFQNSKRVSIIKPAKLWRVLQTDETKKNWSIPVFFFTSGIIKNAIHGFYPPHYIWLLSSVLLTEFRLKKQKQDNTTHTSKNPPPITLQMHPVCLMTFFFLMNGLLFIHTEIWEKLEGKLLSFPLSWCFHSNLQSVISGRSILF